MLTPDDETICNGVTIPITWRAAPRSRLTCTLGEEGEVVGDTWRSSRSIRQTNSVAIESANHDRAAGIGIGGGRGTGGAGRWRDSGMVGAPDRGRTKFAEADFDELDSRACRRHR